MMRRVSRGHLPAAHLWVAAGASDGRRPRLAWWLMHIKALARSSPSSSAPGCGRFRDAKQNQSLHQQPVPGRKITLVRSMLYLPPMSVRIRKLAVMLLVLVLPWQALAVTAMPTVLHHHYATAVDASPHHADAHLAGHQHHGYAAANLAQDHGSGSTDTAHGTCTDVCCSPALVSDGALHACRRGMITGRSFRLRRIDCRRARQTPSNAHLVVPSSSSLA